ncbi:MAG: RagB/SusD family nutrient uptake outer membrane protein [Bacteroidales bacterium]|nr:RagB/SusD family nutrient uptake outer membrane protein [Bacteroidales bacterium]
MKSFIKNMLLGSVAVFAVSFGTTSCVGDLDVTPIDPNYQVIEDAATLDNLFNKCYATLAMAGNSDVDGDVDVDGIDGGTSGFLRQMWNSNELTSDEAICAWGDEGIPGFNFNSYDGSHPMLRGYYYRLYVAITYCNQYLAMSDLATDEVKVAEIRFLRALEYYLALDAFGGNIPLIKAFDSTGGLAPRGRINEDGYTGYEVYDFIESELLDIEGKLASARVAAEGQDGYGRVDQVAAWTLLSRLYLNSQVYTGTPQWAKAKEYAEKVINSPYKLFTDAPVNGYSAYERLFMGNNGTNGAQVESIFSLVQDGATTASWGNTLFLIASTHDANLPAWGTSEAWGGNRALPELVDKFFPGKNAPEKALPSVMVAAAGDDRALFSSAILDKEGNVVDGRTYSIDKWGTFTNGFAVTKFSNIYSDKGMSHDAQYVDTDFFFFRVAEAYLTYAEADVRINGGTATADGLAKLNAVRARAHAAALQSASLQTICDEWSREFYFEGRRRSDLIRFGYYGGNTSYSWTFKGSADVYAGTSFPAYRNIFAIPTTDIVANKNLVQNQGY